MFLQQLLAPFSGGGAAAAAKRRAAVVKARDELISAVVEVRGGATTSSSTATASERRRRADDAVVHLAAIARGERLALDLLGPEPFQVVYASGGFPLWRVTSELAEKIGGGKKKKAKERDPSGGVVASQQFSPSTRQLVNRVDYGRFLGRTVAVTAFGEYAPLFGEGGDEDEQPPVLPLRVRADVRGGSLELGAPEEEEDGAVILPLPIRGQGFFEILFADEQVRVFSSPGPAGTAAISVQMHRRKETGGPEMRRRRR